MQWNVRGMFAEDEVEIAVPPEKGGKLGKSLIFPKGLCEEPAKFDAAVELMVSQSESGAEARSVGAALQRKAAVAAADATVLQNTYRELRKLQESGRNHIWAYVARNMSRPTPLAIRR